MKKLALAALGSFVSMGPVAALADENLFGYVSGAETLPQGASEAYVWLTHRGDKDRGHYSAYDAELEYEYGVTSRFTASLAVLGQSIDTSGLVIDAYLPGSENYGMRFSGVEIKGKYNFLSAAMDPVGLSAMLELHYGMLDPHSGLDKDTVSVDLMFQAQKFFLDDQLVAVVNTGLESTYAKRDELTAGRQADADHALQQISGDPSAAFEWPTDPEMELEYKLGGGVSYRFAPNWYAGGEILYETEFETEVGQERWSLFAGPSIHYGGLTWWATLTYFEQLQGGGEQYVDQNDNNLHLIEKTEHELRLKVGYNF